MSSRCWRSRRPRSRSRQRRTTTTAGFTGTAGGSDSGSSVDGSGATGSAPGVTRVGAGGVEPDATVSPSSLPDVRPIISGTSSVVTTATAPIRINSGSIARRAPRRVSSRSSIETGVIASNPSAGSGSSSVGSGAVASTTGTWVVGSSGAWVNGARSIASIDDVDAAARRHRDLGVEIVEHRRIDRRLACQRLRRIDDPVLAGTACTARHRRVPQPLDRTGHVGAVRPRSRRGRRASSVQSGVEPQKSSPGVVPSGFMSSPFMSSPFISSTTPCRAQHRSCRVFARGLRRWCSISRDHSVPDVYSVRHQTATWLSSRRHGCHLPEMFIRRVAGPRPTPRLGGRVPESDVDRRIRSHASRVGQNRNDRHTSSACRSSLAERVGFEPTDPAGSMPEQGDHEVKTETTGTRRPRAGRHWRRGWDLNPRIPEDQCLSRASHSAALAPLHFEPGGPKRRA